MRWAPTLAGAALMLVAAASHLRSPDVTRHVNAVWLDGLRPGVGRVDFTVTECASALVPHFPRPLGAGIRFSAPGLIFRAADASTKSAAAAGFGGSKCAVRFVHNLFARVTVGWHRNWPAANIVLHTTPHRVNVSAAHGPRFLNASIHAAWLWALGAPMFVVSIFPSAKSLLRLRRERRRRRGACDRCGYDLARLPSEERCPECGVEMRG